MLLNSKTYLNTLTESVANPINSVVLCIIVVWSSGGFYIFNHFNNDRPNNKKGTFSKGF